MSTLPPPDGRHRRTAARLLSSVRTRTAILAAIGLVLSVGGCAGTAGSDEQQDARPPSAAEDEFETASIEVLVLGDSLAAGGP